MALIKRKGKPNFMKNYKPLFSICFGYFMIIIDVTIVNVALPSIAKDLHANLANLAWIVDAYTITFAALLLTTGSLSDKYGAKIIFQIGLSVFILASILCGIAINFQLLLTFRLFQGVGAALLVPTSISLINSSYQDKIELNHAIGTWAAIAGIAAAAGPIIGAMITTIFSWRGIFFINIPFGIICFYFTKIWVDETKPETNTLKFDFWGQIFGVIFIATLAYGLIEVSNDYKALIASAIFATSFCTFLFVEYKSINPMLPLQLFKSKNFSTSILIGFILNMGFYGQLFLLPLYFHQIKTYSIFLSGLAVTPEMLLVALGSYLSGKVVNSLGTNATMIIGLIISVLGFFGIFIAVRYSLAYTIWVIPLLLLGFGTAFIMPAATLSGIKSVAANKTGIASSILNTARQLGSLVGVALFGMIANLSNSFQSGIQHAIICAGSTFLLGVFIVLTT